MKHLFTARVAVVAALLFATAMTALTEGGWWWAVLVGAAVWVLGVRVPFLRGTGLPPASRYILAENARTRRNNRRVARERRRASKIARKSRRTRR